MDAAKLRNCVASKSRDNLRRGLANKTRNCLRWFFSPRNCICSPAETTRRCDELLLYLHWPCPNKNEVLASPYQAFKISECVLFKVNSSRAFFCIHLLQIVLSYRCENTDVEKLYESPLIEAFLLSYRME